MFPIASQFVFEPSQNKFHIKVNGDNERNSRRTQFEIESLLRNPESIGKFVVASNFIEKNSLSHQFNFDQLLIEIHLPKKFSVMTHNIDSHIVPQDPLLRNKFWIRNIKIADDIPGANVMLHFHEDRVELKAIKSVNVNEELLLWFSEEIISFMGIPFLIPGNIQGQTKYVCHHCCRSYENPNPLKLHLARNCDQYEENVIWKRLQAELLSRHQRKLMIHSRNFEQIIAPFHHHHNAMIQSTSATSSSSAGHRFSAFQPVPLKCGQNSPSPPTSMLPMMSNLPSAIANDSALAAAAHLETIVSNMGTSKQGHLCIYCGKLYSRKYGLKIHIRTHTGFKPLKCKFCFRPFGDPSNLNKHIRLHTQANDHLSTSADNSSAPHRCHICNKNLLKRRDLVRHMQLKHSNGTSKIDHQEDSQMTLLSSPASSSSNDEEMENDDDDDEETEVVDC